MTALVRHDCGWLRSSCIVRCDLRLLRQW